MVGKMNQYEIGMDIIGCNFVIGIVMNWYNICYFFGGFFFGVGSGFCVGLVLVVIGIDVGGSMCIFFVFCGVYGFKLIFNCICFCVMFMCVVGFMILMVVDLIIVYCVMF